MSEEMARRQAPDERCSIPVKTKDFGARVETLLRRLEDKQDDGSGSAVAVLTAQS